MSSDDLFRRRAPLPPSVRPVSTNSPPPDAEQGAHEADAGRDDFDRETALPADPTSYPPGAASDTKEHPTVPNLSVLPLRRYARDSEDDPAAFDRETVEYIDPAQMAKSSAPPSALDYVDDLHAAESAGLNSAPQAPLSPADAPHPAPAAEPPPSLEDLRDRYRVGDYSGALDLAEQILAVRPADSQVRGYADKCHDVLVQMYTARLSPLSRVVKVSATPDQIPWLSMDHRAGFLMSLVDGTLTLEEILDVCGMSRLDALRILIKLTEQDVVSLHS